MAKESFPNRLLKTDILTISSFMQEPRSPFRDHLHRMAAVYLVFLVSLIPTIIVFLRAKHNIRERDATRFEELIKTTRSSVFSRMDGALNALSGIRGLFSVSGNVTPEQWESYLVNSGLKGRLPRIISIGFASRISLQNTNQHVAMMRQLGFGDYALSGSISAQDLFPVTHLHSAIVTNSRSLLGWNLASDEIRQEAMLSARDSGKRVSTDKLMSHFGDGSPVEPGLDVYIPVYETGRPVATVEDRQAALRGFVFAYFTSKRILSEIFGRDVTPIVDFEVYDGEVISRENLLFDLDGRMISEKSPSEKRLLRSFQVESLGHTWTWVFAALPAFELPLQRFAPYIALSGGLIITMGLCGIVWTQTKAREAAERMTLELKRSEEALRLSEERYRRLAENAADVIYRFQILPKPKFEYLSPAIEKVLGFHPTQFYDDSNLIIDRLHPEDRHLFSAEEWNNSVTKRTLLFRLIRRDGELIWTELRNVTVHDSEGNLVAIEGIARDVTGAKLVQDKLQTTNDYLESLLDSSLDMIVSVDVDRRIIEFNQAAQTTFGYSKDEVLGKQVDLLYSSAIDGRGIVSQTLSAGTYSGEVVNRRKDGSCFYSFLSASVLKDKSGSVMGIMGISKDVTEGKKSQESLQKSEMRLRALVESIDEILFEFEESGTLINVWTNNERLLARPKSELIGRNGEELFGAELFKRFTDAFERVLKSGKSESLEYYVASGVNVNWFLARISRISSLNDEQRMLCVFARDITERKRSEVALLESQTRLKLINSILAIKASRMETLDIIVTGIELIRECFPDLRAAYEVLDEEGRLAVIYSAGPTDASGIQGQILDLSIAPEYWSIIRRRETMIVDKLCSDRRLLPLVPILDSWGRQAVVDLPLKNAERNVSVLAFDSAAARLWSQHEIITLQEAVECLSSAVKEAETELSRRRAEEALAAEKERLSVTLRSIGEGVITTDTTGRILLVNKAAEQLTGYSAEEAAGKPLINIFRIVHHRSKEPVENPVEKALAGGKVSGMTSQTILIARDELERMISSSAAPIYDTAGGVIGVVLVFRDITEKQKLEIEMLKASKIESLGLLAGGIAHDFNNILTGILGNVSLAKMMGPTDGDMHERLTQAEKACLRAKDLTQQLLTFAKGGTPIKRTAQLTGLVKESVEFALRGSNVRSEITASNDSWPVEVDESQISQVIQNLVINAIEAMPGGGLVRSKLENLLLPSGPSLPLPNGKYVKISIQDEGTGIRPDHLPRIFDPYFSTKQRGSGLGLATAYSIIKRHEGLILVESALGLGTTFSIFLPASERIASFRPEGASATYKGRGRILVMDDELLIQNLAKAVLSHLGYEVDLAKNGNEAIDAYAKALSSHHRYDVVIMDLTIPGGMGGKEAIRKLHALDPNVKAIVSSGYSNDPVMSQYKEYGFVGVVSKPYKIEELSRVLFELLKERTESV